MKHSKVSFFSATYNTSLAAFRKQFIDVVYITNVYVNKEGKVYAGEWYDSKGIVNFNGGYLLDLAKTIQFI
jgi:hypothetical protein